MYAIALGGIVNGLIATIINSYPNGKLLNYSYKEQWKDIMPSLLLSLVMGAVVYCIKFIGLDAGITLIFQIILGATLYVGIAYLFKHACLKYLLNTMEDLMRIKTNGGAIVE